MTGASLQPRLPLFASRLIEPRGRGAFVVLISVRRCSVIVAPMKAPRGLGPRQSDPDFVIVDDPLLDEPLRQQRWAAQVTSVAPYDPENPRA